MGTAAASPRPPSALAALAAFALHAARGRARRAKQKAHRFSCELSSNHNHILFSEQKRQIILPPIQHTRDFDMIVLYHAVKDHLLGNHQKTEVCLHAELAT